MCLDIIWAPTWTNSVAFQHQLAAVSLDQNQLSTLTSHEFWAMQLDSTISRLPYSAEDCLADGFTQSNGVSTPIF